MRTFRTGLLIGLSLAVATGAAAIAYKRYDTKTLKRTIQRDAVLCGVNTGLPGFSSPDDKGNWSGFDVDLCRAVAAAIFDDPRKVTFVPLDANERFKELQARKVDILSRNSTWSMSRETSNDLYFPAVAYYAGQGFMTPRPATSTPRLRSTAARSASRKAPPLNSISPITNNIKYHEMKFGKLDEAVKAYESGQCDTFISYIMCPSFMLFG